MRKLLAAGIAALGLLLVFSDFADAAGRGGGGGGGGFRGGGGGGGFRGGGGGGYGGFRGGYGYRGYGYGGLYGGLFIGPDFYDPFWWPYDPYYYPFDYPSLPPQALYQYAPPAGYLPTPNGSAAQQYWYRCGNPEGYYPYVRSCMTGWEQVPVTPGSVPTPVPAAR